MNTISEPKRKSKKIIDFLQNHLKIIDYSDSIIHFKQTGQQCWARSSQMFLSYLLHTLGFSKEEISIAFYDNLFIYDEYRQNTDLYLQLNQMLLGRRLRSSEKVYFTLDELVEKIYIEFGSTAFSAEVFAAFMKNYLQALSKVTHKFRSATIILIIDNDEEEEVFEQESACTIIYRTFNFETNSRLKTGMLQGDDSKLWNALSKEEKKTLIADLLQFSPILSEVPGHAFVISGIDYSDSTLIINDSLSNKVYKSPLDSNLNLLTAFVMLAKIKL